MSLIYHRFPSEHAAQAFTEAAALLTESSDVHLFATQAAADEHDPYPFELTPPIVHVTRESDAGELELERLADSFGGRFAGT